MPESPPKPWEQAQGTSSATSVLPSTTQAITSPSTATDAITSGMGDLPTVPGRPSTMTGTTGYGGSKFFLFFFFCIKTYFSY